MFLQGWDKEQMLSDFGVDASVLDGAEILLASYGEDHGYDGIAFVLYCKEGALYEVNGSHCSCYGLEEQWEPEPTDKNALLTRLDADYFGKSPGSPFHEELRAILATL
jgi:hypothetical protein